MANFAQWTQRLIDAGLTKDQRDAVLSMVIEGIDINVECGEFRMFTPKLVVEPINGYADAQKLLTCGYEVKAEGIDSRQIVRTELPTIDYRDVQPMSVNITYCLMDLPKITIEKPKNNG